MGSSGGNYYSARDLDVLRDEANRRIEQAQQDADVNHLLQQELVGINDRDYELVNRYLGDIETVLRDEIEEVDRILFGGSVAKHTYVDGLSDIDALVILKDPALLGDSSERMRETFVEALLRQLPQGNIGDITMGRMAVTITYRDGTSIQLLPAIEVDGEVSVSSADGLSWIKIRPREFAQKLTESNLTQRRMLVPVIKLAKVIATRQLEDNAPSGYHMESLAIEVFKDYTGAYTPKAMLQYFFQSASQTVLRPISDITGQSIHVDDVLGPANSERRQQLSRQFEDLGKQMTDSRTPDDWERLLH